jgi:hypothetical protein
MSFAGPGSRLAVGHIRIETTDTESAARWRERFCAHLEFNMAAACYVYRRPGMLRLVGRNAARSFGSFTSVAVL